ncbi:MAG: hypothetical protein ABIH58_00165 [Patescibacteria group bacterium]
MQSSHFIRWSYNQIYISRHDPISRIPDSGFRNFIETINKLKPEWMKIGESTSSHLKIINYYIDECDNHLFVTINCDTDEAMGMNMVTIAAQAIGEWIEAHIPELEFITVAGNVDSDKKPSKRTHDLGRGYEVFAEAELSEEVIKDVLHTTPYSLLTTAQAKLESGSKVAESIGSNLQAANIIAALYLATGQDAAHVVEGSMADTTITDVAEDRYLPLRISVRCPAILVGVRGGGTQLPAQSQCLQLLTKPINQLTNQPINLHLAEIIGAAVLAGEISLLAAQATHTLAKSHKSLARNSKELERPQFFKPKS